MHKLFFIWLAALVASAQAEELDLTLRHRTILASPNLVDAYASYTGGLSRWLLAEVGARVSTSTDALEAVDYKGELRARIFPFWDVNARLYHSNRLAEGTGLSQWSATTTLHAWAFSFIGFAVTAGWQQRYVILEDNVGLPIFANSSFMERDIAGRIAILVRPARRWELATGLSNIEEFDVYNLNSPFVFLNVEHAPAGERWAVMAFTRYRVLLGFGRRDEIVVGAGIRFALGK